MVSIEETVKRPGYNLMFVGIHKPSKAQLSAAIDDLCEHQVEGLVLGGRVEGSTDNHKPCRGIPFVALDPSDALKVPTVIVDQQYGTRVAIQHLLDLGHKQIVCIGGPPRWSASKERRKGWTTALKQAGLEPSSLVEGDRTPESGFRAATQLLERAPRKFTAIVAAGLLDCRNLFVSAAAYHGALTRVGEKPFSGFDQLRSSFNRNGSLCLR